MATETIRQQAGAQEEAVRNLLDIHAVIRAARTGLIVALVMAALAFLFGHGLRPLIASARVEETVTASLMQILLFFLPYATYIAIGGTLRSVRKIDTGRAVLAGLVALPVVFAVITAGQAVADVGPFSPRSTLGLTLAPATEGTIVETLEPGGQAEEAGLQVGDLIVGIRRDTLDMHGLLTRIRNSPEDTVLRLRFLRDGEEIQAGVRVGLDTEMEPDEFVREAAIALALVGVAMFWPGGWVPYILLVGFLSPLLVGYIWVIIATFSYRTRGILPLDGQGNIGGFTFDNWSFLVEGTIAGMRFNIWQIALNSLIIAATQTVFVLIVSSMAAYALSRMNFFGRRSFLSFTLILHGFPAITLLIPIFFVLRNISQLPLVGGFFGYNTLGGIALVMVAFELPLGVWLMKGFFDHIPWDIERSALIDGASRWRTFWEILLPQIRPGILALGIFAFISGWNAFIIPQTYSVGAGAANLPVFLNELIDETAPVDWNQVAAVGLFQLIPIMAFFIFAQEYLLNIYAGGTKGSS
jgi:inositol-phosphate transport system permease protein